MKGASPHFQTAARVYRVVPSRNRSPPEVASLYHYPWDHRTGAAQPLLQRFSLSTTSYTGGELAFPASYRPQSFPRHLSTPAAQLFHSALTPTGLDRISSSVDFKSRQSLNRPSRTHPTPHLHARRRSDVESHATSAEWTLNTWLHFLAAHCLSPDQTRSRGTSAPKLASPSSRGRAGDRLRQT